jgi:nitrite reductase/ring-hydroxylating ferredoxin subunit
MKVASVFILVLVAVATDAYIQTTTSFGFSTRRSDISMKRGRGSFKKEIGGGSDSGMGSSGRISSSSSTNWIIVPKATPKDLPKEEGKVSLLETQALPLVDRNTNPMGAVSVLKYGPETFCFSVQCPSCKIPLTKAKALPPNEETGGKAPRIACDFCKSTYSLKTGQKLGAQEGGGLLGSLVKNVMAANNDSDAPLPVYKLGEKDNRILFAMK